MAFAQFHARWPWVVGATLLFALAAQACDTPVYLYTLLYWQRDPYRVCYLYRGSEATEDAAVNSQLEQMAKTHANIMFVRIDGDSIDTSGRGSLAQYVWERHGSEELPRHVVLTPRGVELLSGRLDSAALEGLAKSPKRTEMAEQLCEGKHGVLVLLKGPLADDNAAAEKVVRAVMAAAKEEQSDVGLVLVRRDDPKEKWFVRQLLILEPDLKDLKNAMVFAVFGRGHVLEPYLGKGITEMNLAEVIWFMNGPCSCEIKMTAPGMDVLTDWNWDRHLASLPELEEGPVSWGLFDIEEATPPPAPEESVAPTPAPAPEKEPAAEADVEPEKTDAAAKPAEAPKQLPPPIEAAQTEEEPSAPAPAVEKTDEIPAVNQVARAPALPTRVSAATETETEAQDKASFTSVMGRGLALALGAGVVVALLVGVVLVKTRKQS